jgi:hypothetical protein
LRTGDALHRLRAIGRPLRESLPRKDRLCFEQEMQRFGIAIASALLLEAVGCSAGYAESAPLAVPGPIAFPCENDVPCGTHRCNAAYGKCTFPCQSDVDCITPNACVMGLCVPETPQR